MKRLFTLLLAAVVLTGMSAVPAAAKSQFPAKPITVLNVFGPGGAADLAMRVVAEYATQHGMTMNVVNKPTGSGTAAALEVVKARPDGYTLLFSSQTAIATMPRLKKVGYTLEDLQPVANVSNMYLTFCVRSDSGINSMDEWFRQAGENPGKFTYASPGSITSQVMFLSVLIKDKFPNIQVSHVPYASGHEVNTALLGKHITAAFGVPGTNKNYLQSGDFKLIAVTSPKRLPEYPDAPTFAELYGEERVWTSYHALFASRKTPKEVVNQISDMVGRALADPQVQDKLEKIGAEASYENPEEFQKTMDTMIGLGNRALDLMGM